MKRSQKLSLATVLIGLIFAASGCDPSYSTLDTYGAGRYSAGGVTVVVAHAGDFTADQLIDIQSVVSDMRDATGCDFRWLGLAPWRSTDVLADGSSAQPSNHVIFEKRTATVGGYIYPSMGWPGNDGQGNASRGIVYIGPSNDWRPAPSIKSYTSGPTWRGVALHESGHALGVLADMYSRDDGHPGLIMGRGFESFNQFALGDLDGLHHQGCRS